jgi:hypothetical protein
MKNSFNDTAAGTNDTRERCELRNRLFHENRATGRQQHKANRHKSLKRDNCNRGSCDCGSSRGRCSGSGRWNMS